MGNQHSHPPPCDACCVCKNVTSHIFKAFESMGCEPAAGGVEAACQTFVAFNLEDGIGEFMEPVCDVLPSVFETTCKIAAKHTHQPWVDTIAKAACKKVHLC